MIYQTMTWSALRHTLLKESKVRNPLVALGDCRKELAPFTCYLHQPEDETFRCLKHIWMLSTDAVEPVCTLVEQIQCSDH